MEERYSFAPRDLEALETLKTSLESQGFTCTVETSTLTRHEFVLLTLVATPPKKPTRVERGCSI